MSGLPTEPAELKAEYVRCASQNVSSIKAIMSSEAGDVVRKIEANQMRMAELIKEMRKTDPTAAATWEASYYRTPAVEEYRGKCSSCCALTDALAECAEAVFGRLDFGDGPVEVALTGGLGQNVPAYRDMVHRAVEGQIPGARCVEARATNLVGAALLALEGLPGTAAPGAHARLLGIG